MKKLIFIVVVLLGSICSYSQTFSHTTSNPTGAVSNAGIDTMTYVLKSQYVNFTVQPIYSRSANTAAGTMILAISTNGTNYVNTDTLTLANVATNTTIWNKVSAARYLRIITSGGTTVTATTSARIVAGY